MISTLATTAIAVIGALLAALITGRFQERAAERAVRAGRDEAVRSSRLEAVVGLAETVSGHRAAMWRRGNALLKDAPADRLDELASASDVTRAAISRPLTSMRVLIEDRAVRTAANEMVTLTYALRDAHGSEAQLTAAREAAKSAHDRFVDAAARYLTAA